MAVNSEYFQAMFTVQMKESQTQTIVMDSIEESDFGTFDKLISFMYTGKAAGIYCEYFVTKHSIHSGRRHKGTVMPSDSGYHD